MQLTDFFAPINFYNLAIFFLAFFVFDAIGVKIASVIANPTFLRPVYWSFGLGIFIFVWFLLHFFIPFWPNFVWISLIIFGLVFLPGYIKKSEWKSLLLAVKNFPYPLVFLLIVAKPLFFLLSAPPYYTDELAYHFYSPVQLYTETHWPFLNGPGLYDMVPKFLNTAYVLMFSLSKTYVTARILHFLLVFSAIYAISLFVKKRINSYAAVLYSFFALFISSHFLNHTTLGYVDAGAAAFANLFLVIVVEFLQERKKELLMAAAVVLGLTIGMKYTILAFLGSVIVITFIIIIISRQLKRSLFKDSLITAIFAIIFGGYWYIKNTVLTGNPIFPFLFKCFGAVQCGTGYDFFASWAIPLDGYHFDLIRSVLFQGSMNLFSVTVAFLLFSLMISFILNLRPVKLLATLIPLVVFWEILLSKDISGFELRYFFHWVLLIPLVLILPFAILSKTKLLSKKFQIGIFLVLTILLFSTAGLVSLTVVKRVYEPDFVPGFVRNFAMRRTTLYEWIDYYAPQTNEVIKWCGEARPMQNLIVIDPSLIWSGYELRMFMTNCTLNVIGPGKDRGIDEYAQEVRGKYNNSYLVSGIRCGTSKPEVSFAVDVETMRRHELNVKLICNSKEILKNLYLISNSNNL